MASQIQTFLDKIKSAVYGVEVRDAIHDSIKECYEDVTAGKTLAETAAKNTKTAITNAEEATKAAKDATTAAKTEIQNAKTATEEANTSKKKCDDAVAALPETITNLFATLGLVLVDGKLCVSVTKDND